jgi:outer membrane lipoprotein-sorting protein
MLAAGCVVRQRERISRAELAPAWQQATLGELLERVRAHEQAIETFQATVEIEPSVTRVEQAEIVRYRDVRAFILIRRPTWLRMIGLYPVARTTAFDMASDGEQFRLYIPLRNRFIIGNSRKGRLSESALENLRPQHILEALLWEGPHPGQERAALEVSEQGAMSYYVVHVLRDDEQKLTLARNLWFERRGLSLERLQIFDEAGEEVTDARYFDYGEFAGVRYPQRITIDRPKDRYGLALTVSKLELNLPLADDKFRLEQPPGTELRNLDEPVLAGQANNHD